MSDNSKAWILGSFLGLIGIVLAAVLFVFITLKTGHIFGIAAILCGAIAGGAVGFGYKMGGGRIGSKSEAQLFLWVLTGFGFLGVLAAYFGQYILPIIHQKSLTLPQDFVLRYCSPFIVLYILFRSH